MSGNSVPTSPSSVSEFFGLPGDRFRKHYFQIRRKQCCVEQLSAWVSSSISAKTGATEQPHWAEFLAMIGKLETEVTNANKNIGAKDTVVAAPHYFKFLVSACMKATMGCDFSTDKEMLDHLMKLFSIEDRDRPDLTVLAHTLRRTPVIGRAVVPVAFVERETRLGLLARLEVEVFAEGPKIMCNHPAQTFESSRTVKFMSDLLGSLEKAFLAGSKEAGVELCGRWRLLEWAGEKSIPESLDGPSLGAAAARAWSFALKKQKADPRVLVIAQAKESGELLPLEDNDGVSLKVARVCELIADADPIGPDAIDTVVVVGAANRKAAQSAIDTAEAGRRLRVVMLEEGDDKDAVAKAA